MPKEIKEKSWEDNLRQLMFLTWKERFYEGRKSVMKDSKSSMLEHYGWVFVPDLMWWKNPRKMRRIRNEEVSELSFDKLHEIAKVEGMDKYELS